VNKISLKMKLAGGFGALLLLIAIMAWISYSSIDRLSVLTDEVSKQMLKKQFAIEADGGLELQTSSTRGFLLSGQEQVLKRRDEGMKQFDDSLSQLSKLLQTEREKAVHTHLEAASKELQALQGHAIELRRAQKSKESAAALFSDRAVELRADVEKSVDDLTAMIDALQQAALAEHEQVEGRTMRLIIGLAIAGLVVGLGVAALVVRSITGAMSRMLSMIQEIADKNLTVEDLQIASEDEIGKAGIALNRMKCSLHEVIHSIAETAQHVASASEELSATSQQISANSEETSAQASVVAQAAQQVSQNLSGVSTGAEEMTSTIHSIASNAHEAATVASSAVQTAQAANTTVGKLGESSVEIGEVIKVMDVSKEANLKAGVNLFTKEPGKP
jgi:methyl-accepting chemotaxis protein